jgi:lysophospholipase L1-like esterase
MKSSIPGVEIYNCATGGLGSQDGKDRASYIAKLTPDYVVVTSFGFNDYWRYKLGTNKHRANIRDIIQDFEGSKVVIWQSPPVYDPHDRKVTEEVNRTLHDYSESIKKLCKKMDVEFIDSFAIYENYDNRTINYHEEDGVHLTDEGYKPFIQELTKILNK